MKVAVTGASGFIGRHVIAELEKLGVEIIAPTRVEFDISQPPKNCFETLGKPDVLIHLAWQGLPNYKSPHHFETQLPKQYNFLSRLIREGLPSLVVAGTCFEYGLQSGPLAANIETYPITAYGLAKDTLRKQLQFLQQVQSFKFTWARLFYIFGEGQPETSLLPKLKKAVISGQDKFQMSAGEQLRDYLPVSEVARQLVGLAVRDYDHGVVNICSGKPISVRRLVESWVREQGCKIELDLGDLPYPDYEPMAFWGVVSSLKK